MEKRKEGFRIKRQRQGSERHILGLRYLGLLTGLKGCAEIRVGGTRAGICTGRTSNMQSRKLFNVLSIVERSRVGLAADVSK